MRGFLSAYDVKTGKQVWKFYLTPGDPKKGPDHAASDSIQKMAAATWAGQWYKHGGGASPWNTVVYDPKYNLVLTGTGNGSPTNPWIRSGGKGANLSLPRSSQWMPTPQICLALSGKSPGRLGL